MPNIKSAKERVKLSAKQNSRNRMDKSALRTSIKKFESALAGQDTALIGETYKAAAISLDRAASKGIIHKNTAARKKSRLSANAANVSAN